jgi:hypothetical protein
MCVCVCGMCVCFEFSFVANPLKKTCRGAGEYKVASEMEGIRAGESGERRGREERV